MHSLTHSPLSSWFYQQCTLDILGFGLAMYLFIFIYTDELPLKKYNNTSFLTRIYRILLSIPGTGCKQFTDTLCV